MIRLPRWMIDAALLAFLCAPLVARGADAFSPEQIAHFESKVRPILVEKCQQCHGEKKQEGGVRLDSREAMLKGGDSGPLFVPGATNKSLLAEVVTHAGDTKMPPDGPLPDAAKTAISTWIQMGAPWPQDEPGKRSAASRPENHWAYQPIRRHGPPTVNDAGWPSTFVDRFILAKLEFAGVAPSPDADRRTLIRRLSFDLTGLPPAAEEVDAFVADQDPRAYERLVERLLASPRYGERWARHWLDIARYGDTKAYVFTEDRLYRHAFTYRDYVIESLNADKPFDQFVIEQIAADLLPGEDKERLAALGFLTLGRRYLGDVQEIIDDRIDVVTRGLMGLSVTCARCHDHKYDPVPTEDYYSLYGVFASTTEPGELPPLPRKRVLPEMIEFEKSIAERESRLAAMVAENHQRLQTEVRERLGDYLLVAFDAGFDPKKGELEKWSKERRLNRALAAWIIEKSKPAIDQLLAGPDPSLAPWRVAVSKQPAEVPAAVADACRQKFVPPAIKLALSATPIQSARDVIDRYGKLFNSLGKPVDPKTPGPIDAASLAPISLTRDAILAALSIPGDQAEALLDGVSKKALDRAREGLARVRRDHPGQPRRAMVLLDAPKPNDPYVFVRGNPGRRGKDVPRQFLGVLSGPNRQPFGQGSGRLELARAIASPNNPLTARVIVNRVWMHHFGAGLVRTPGDFGVRGDTPTHPELLDELAGRFIAEGWSLKWLHRAIVLSRAYRQRSDVRDDAFAIDPENKLVWKQNRRRLEFEQMRDAMLTVAGRLDPAIGGRSASLTAEPYTTRRTLYGFVDRQNIDSIFRTFDFPNPNVSSPRRAETTTPQQSLYLLNNPFVLEQARRLGRDDAPIPTDEIVKRVRDLYRRALGREPVDQEIELARRYLALNDSTGADAEIWRYGFGEYDAAKQRVAVFHHLSHWSGDSWRVDKEFPHPAHGHAMLTAAGGHPGPDLRHAVVRRWVAPRDIVVRVKGKIEHGDARGDGVRGRVVSSRGGELGVWLAGNGSTPTPVERVALQRGEWLDFIVDGRDSDSFDTFAWAPTVEAIDGMGGAWESSNEFAGPAPTTLTPWQSYAHALLLSNEFMFID